MNFSKICITLTYVVTYNIKDKLNVTYNEPLLILYFASIVYHTETEILSKM